MKAGTATAEYLLSKGVKPSYPRVKVLDYMLEKRNHPTVDMIYSALSKEIPTLSRTTVYNTVRLFVDKEVVQMIGIDEQEVRYDADLHRHAHFRCDLCGDIYDLEVESSGLFIKNTESLKIREIHYYLKGLCKHCQTLPESSS